MPASPSFSPTIIDRLVDACAGMSEPRPVGVESLIDDIEDLLNTCSVAPGAALDGLPEASDSLLGYGTAPPASLAIATHEERLAAARSLQRTLLRYEPRLERVRVRVDDTRPTCNEGRFRIEATLREAPAESVALNIRVRSSSGRTQVTTERS
ncbi:lysozyme-like protein [Pseudobythopirellula maris]|uniref:Lysozyme-like protein n=1 Tax=Pseudobythopirellula maris TaxID=2527991 RepID=A0A5C5ZR94_9BACT|nr:type VI secretion system baseplate subunit TssE [Pseudobythopirellula maris]TWT90072.1 lysozyme-like protein [Pseudobythopirellula maris]